MERVRILHLIESLHSGGAERLLATHLRWLDRRRFDSCVVSLFPPDDLEPAIRAIGVDVHRLQLRGPRDLVRGILALRRLLRTLRIDLVHTHLFYASFVGRLAAWLAGVRPVVTSLHNADYLNQDHGGWSFRLRRVADFLTGRLWTTRWIAVAEFVRQDFVRRGIPDIQVLYNCVDLNEFPSERSQRWRAGLGLSPEDFVLVNVGRLHEQKGQRSLIQAVAKVRKRVGEHVKLLLVGEGPLRAELERLTRALGMEQAVRFLGKRSDVPAILALADLFVFPSNYEGLPIAPIEAMAMRLPIVATRVAGIPEVVEDGVSGLLIDLGDQEALIRAIVRLHDDPGLRSTLGERGRQVVEKRFNAATLVHELEALYLDEVRARGRPGHPSGTP